MYLRTRIIFTHSRGRTPSSSTTGIDLNENTQLSYVWTNLDKAVPLSVNTDNAGS